MHFWVFGWSEGIPLGLYGPCCVTFLRIAFTEAHLSAVLRLCEALKTLRGLKKASVLLWVLASRGGAKASHVLQN